MAASVGKVRVDPSIHFAQHLAANEKKIRDKAVKKVSNWLKGRSMKDTGFTLEELLKLWKGLFYCMWMSDKMIVQEDLGDSLSQMVHCLQTPQQGLMFFEAFMEIMKRDLNGIDNLRLDKFLMLIRRTFCQTLILLKNQDWSESLVKSFLGILRKYPLNPDQDSCPDSIRFYVIDIYIEELSRIGGDELSEEQVLTFLEPLIELASLTKVKSVNNVIMVQIFEEIVRQARVEADHEEHLEFIEDDHKRMRADGVKVFEELPMLEFDLEGICKLLFTHASKADTLARNRKRIYKTVTLYRNLVKGIHPSQLIVAEKKEIKDTFLYLEKPWLKEKEEKEKLRLKAKREKRKKQRQKKRMERGGGDGETQGGRNEENLGGGDDENQDEVEKELRGGVDGDEEGDGEMQSTGERKSDGEDAVRQNDNDGGKTQGDETKRKFKKLEGKNGDNDVKTMEDDNDDDVVVQEEDKMVLDEEVRLQPPKEKRQLRKSKRKSGVGRRGKDEVMEEDASKEGLDKMEGEKSVQVESKESNNQDNDAEKATRNQDSIVEVTSQKKGKGKRRAKMVKADALESNQEEQKEPAVEERMQTLDTHVGGEDEVVMEKPEKSELAGDERKKLKESDVGGMKEQQDGERKRQGRKRGSKVEKTESGTLAGKKKRKQSLGRNDADGNDRSNQSDVFSDTYSPPVTRKRVKISLAKNQESSTTDYQRRVSASPGIPFDKKKKPEQPAIKPSPSPPKRVTRRSLRNRNEKRR